MTKLQTLLGVELPIIQAPMAGVQGSALAIAVSNAGGLGSLPCAMLSLDALRSELAAITCADGQAVSTSTSSATRRPFPAPSARRPGGRHSPPTTRSSASTRVRSPRGADARRSAPRLPTSSASSGPPVVSFHFGLPSAELLARVRSWGAKVLSSATTVEEARWLEARGVDAVIAQGVEAGGHRGMFLSDDLTTQVGTLALVPQIVNAVKMPVIAAGGIADARGVAAALALGAAGVQVGTAYLLCPEATTSAVHRAALKSEAARHTALTNVFTGRPARDRQPPHAGGRPDERRGARLSLGRRRHRPLARESREPEER